MRRQTAGLPQYKRLFGLKAPCGNCSKGSAGLEAKPARTPGQELTQAEMSEPWCWDPSAPLQGCPQNTAYFTMHHSVSDPVKSEFKETRWEKIQSYS